MKILLIDIETAPHTVYAWGLWNQNIGINQVATPGYTICFAAKWYGKRGVMFHSAQKDGQDGMVQAAWDLLNEADAVVHYNGARFDVPTLNKEFIKHDLTPPAPYHQIDLLKVVKRQFRFFSNKLDAVLRFLGMPQKMSHKGFDLWRECMEGDDKAWRTMERYNRRDVTTMERLYDRVLPWITTHPNHALYADTERPLCPNCGGKVTAQGYRHTKTQTYRRYQCQDCGAWSRDRTTVVPRSKRRLVQA